MTGLEKKKELYNLRNGYLKYNPYFQYTEINVYKFFELIYSRNDEMPLEECEGASQEHQNHKYHGIVTEILKDRARHFMIFNDLNFLEEIKDREFVITSPISYIGRNRTANNSRYLYAIAIDLDGVEEKHIGSLFKQFSNGRIYPPNIVVSSGNGLHLYYILKEPIALFDNVKELMKRFKYGLIDLVWSSFTSKQTRQYQGIFQGFRVPETQTKFGELVKAYINYDIPFYDIRALNRRLDDDIKLTEEEILQIERVVYKPKRISLAKAKELYPEWYERRIVKGDKTRKKWEIKRDLYDWWKRKITSNKEVQEGHRYFCLMTLSMYATKCNIPYEELKKDAYSFLEEMEQKTVNQDNHFTEEDIEDALRAYKESYTTFPRKDIERITGLSIPANKRNGRKQADHIKMMNLIRDEINKNVNWRQGNGRKEKKDIVFEWRVKNQLGTKAQCIRDTKLDKKTVYKWWEYANNKIRNLGRYEKYSDIPLSHKKYIYRQMQDRYIFDNMTEEEKKDMRRIDFIHEVLKLLDMRSYEIAKRIYWSRQRKKKAFLEKISKKS